MLPNSKQTLTEDLFQRTRQFSKTGHLVEKANCPEVAVSVLSGQCMVILPRPFVAGATQHLVTP